ncbi:WD40 repeat-like protein [Polychaeton citri CBS 116435]|uniref:WD40 repeat-like protein n=1 Tax=Polychaeton citri CBS 116435 TaxID=1314669 RepID=A0A9P4Q8D4_9PEZI|nr:WD40 repeat-like protein [Polychaeton citri CBS 116435]
MGPNGFHRFNHGHNDLVLSIDHNLYGNRAATASSDHQVKVWDRSDVDGQWQLIDTFTAHEAEVTEVRWNGPYVGEHIATIGEDGFLKVWEEDPNEGIGSGKRFKKIFQVSSVTGVPYMSLDLKNFGPESYLAVVSHDGYLSVCEPENHDSLSSWRTIWSDYVGKTPARTEEAGFRVSWHKESLPAWPAVLAGLDRKTLSLAVSTGDKVKIYRTDKDRKFYTAAQLDGAKALVRDVSWANGSMRGFDLIATASKDGFIRIYELHTPGASSMDTSSGLSHDAIDPASTNHLGRHNRSGIGAGLAGSARGRREEYSDRPGAVTQEPKLVAELEAHDGAPWRVAWSQNADTLVSTGDDGTVKLWKKASDGKWLEAAEIDATKET